MKGKWGVKIRFEDFRHRVTFQKSVETPDGYKGHTITWESVVTVWAQVKPLSGREYFYAHQIKNVVSHRIRMRYRTDVNAEMRIRFGDRYFSIESIFDMEEGQEFLEILCQEKK